MSFTNYDEVNDLSQLGTGKPYIYDAGILGGVYLVQLDAFDAEKGKATLRVLHVLEEGMSSMALDHYSPGTFLELFQRTLGWDMDALHDPSSTAQGGMHGRILAEFGDLLEQFGINTATL